MTRSIEDTEFPVGCARCRQNPASIATTFVGLANKAQDDASRFYDASRRAFNNLITLAIEEECVTAGMQMAMKLVNAGSVPPSLRRRIPQLYSKRKESAKSVVAAGEPQLSDLPIDRHLEILVNPHHGHDNLPWRATALKLG